LKTASRIFFARARSRGGGSASEDDPANKVKGKFGVVPLPDFTGEGSSSLGGLNFAVSAFSKKQQSATELLKLASTEEQMKNMSMLSAEPPAWSRSSPTCRC
jgi:trehalose/maltose transport system substrate-binding protein